MTTQWLCEVSEQPIEANSCIECARARKCPGCPVAVPGLLRALAHSMKEDEGLAAVRAIARVPVVRVSTLIGCRRKAWYASREDYPLEKPSDMWPRLRGVIFHRGLENGSRGEEMRLFTRVKTSQGEAIITGRIDNYDEAHRVLWDYKTINTWKSLANFDLPKASHERQLALYAWLLAQNGKVVNRAYITYITMAEIRITQVELPDPSDVEAEVRDTVSQVLPDTPPPPTPREEWECRYCPWTQCPGHPNHNKGDEGEDIFN